MRLAKGSGSVTYLGYTAITLTTVYTIIITILGLKTMQMMKYIYDSNRKKNKD